LSSQKSIDFIFGLNIKDMFCDGFFIYIQNRLIRVEKPRMNKNNQPYEGIVGIVNLPYTMIRPSLNKQELVNIEQKSVLLNKFRKYRDFYLQIELIRNQNFVPDTEFWKQYGYFNIRTGEPPSTNITYLARRMSSCKLTIQCDACLKWRQFQLCAYKKPPNIPMIWNCNDMINGVECNCDTSEELDTIIKISYVDFKKIQVN
jgi:hypothetical protein